MKNKLLLPLMILFCVNCIYAESEFEKLPEIPVTGNEIGKVLGVSSWSAKLSIPAGKNRQIMVYAKRKGKPAILLVDGPVVRNDGGKNAISRRVVVAIDGLITRPWQPKLKVGVGMSIGKALMTDTVIVSNPIPKTIYPFTEQLGLMKDSKGRMLLVQGNSGGMTAYPGVDAQEYAIYLILEEWKPKP